MELFYPLIMVPTFSVAIFAWLKGGTLLRTRRQALRALTARPYLGLGAILGVASSCLPAGGWASSPPTASMGTRRSLPIGGCSSPRAETSF